MLAQNQCPKALWFRIDVERCRVELPADKPRDDDGPSAIARGLPAQAPVAVRQPQRAPHHKTSLPLARRTPLRSRVLSARRCQVLGDRSTFAQRLRPRDEKPCTRFAGRLSTAERAPRDRGAHERSRSSGRPRVSRRSIRVSHLSSNVGTRKLLTFVPSS